MKSVLVTGASSGIGLATALHLAGQGYRVFAGVRDVEESVGLDLAAHGTIRTVELDVTDEPSIAAAMETVRSEVGDAGLAGVVNNAGEGFPGPLESLSLDDLRRQLEVNVVGQVAVTQHALPLVRQARGRIVFVGSIGGKLAVEFAGAYNASKFAMEGIADSWRQELQPEGIKVSLIEPGVVKTAIWDKAVARLDAADRAGTAHPRYRERLHAFRASLVKANEDGMDPEQVARVIETALSSPRPSTRYPVGASAALAYRLKPWIPDSIYDRLARRVGGA